MNYDKIVKKYSELLPQKLINDILDNIKNEKLSEEKVEKIFRKTYEEYVKILAEPGLSVGLIAAQSFGEPATQMTLDTFHLAGVSELNISLGLPRIIELLDGRKTTKTPITYIYLVPPYNTKENVKIVAMKLKETKLKEIVESIELDLMNYTIKLKFNLQMINILELSLADISSRIKKHLRGADFVEEKDTITIRFDPELEIKVLYKIKEHMKDFYVSGIKGIKHVISKEIENENGEKEFMILAAGQNLGQILKLPFVDPYRTYSNDINEVLEFLGIEAARELFFREVYAVISEQGLDIDLRYISLFADAIMAYGDYKGITRYGLIKNKSSVLARATFETPISHFVDAALSGENEKLIGLMESVIVGQPPNVGTSLSEITYVNKVSKSKSN
ncbi:MAG: DNA-directed RNA polymerase subunit A'' [Candidatus Woesearchaeota archaeon]